MLVWRQKSRYEINYSHFFRGGWRRVLQLCNVRAHKIIISACTIDFRPTLTYESTSDDLSAATFDLFLRRVWCIIWLQKGKHCGVFRGRDVTLCSHSAECFFAAFCNQTWYCGAPPWAGMSCKKMGFYLQGQGHSVGLYNQNMTVSAISFISSKPVSLLQPNSIWV